MSVEIVEYTVKDDEKRSGEPHLKRNKIYVWVDGESLGENLVNRRNRPSTFYRNDVLPKLMEKMETEHPEMYRKLKDEKWLWNQSCGCSMCPCSPGFVGEGLDKITVHVTFKIK